MAYSREQVHLGQQVTAEQAGQVVGVLTGGIARLFKKKKRKKRPPAFFAPPQPVTVVPMRQPAQAGIGMPMGPMAWLVILAAGGILAWTMMRPRSADSMTVVR